MRKFFKLIFSKTFIFSLMILMQIVLLVSLVIYFEFSFKYFYAISTAFSILLVFVIINRDINPAYQLVWSILILAIPVFGGLTYIILGRNNFGKKNVKRVRKVISELDSVSQKDLELYKAIESSDEYALKCFNYISKTSNYHANIVDELEYFALGEEFFERLKIELKKAKKFIFMEYFIIDKGKMWSEILEILIDKVKEGVDVRLIYDDLGTLFLLPNDYFLRLERLGIKTYLFNPFIPFIKIQMNNRTHRKITVIDGEVGFTGGINLADEYINEKVRFGHWKDTAIMITGKAVNNLTKMFLQFWGVKYGAEKDYNMYMNTKLEKISKNNQYIVPFMDSPIDKENVFENIFLQMIYNAKKYIYINTPYLIIDNELKQAFLSQAKAGVDVRIMIPHIPDKKSVYLLTKSFAEELVQGGVKVYEYIPGFIHAKSFVSDDKYSVIGTCNLDYRSLYLHFECGAYVCGEQFAKELKLDFDKSVEVSKQITTENIKNGFLTHIKRSILRFFAPLL